jgi:hypothetical protein
MNIVFDACKQLCEVNFSLLLLYGKSEVNPKFLKKKKEVNLKYRIDT